MRGWSQVIILSYINNIVCVEWLFFHNRRPQWKSSHLMKTYAGNTQTRFGAQTGSCKYARADIEWQMISCVFFLVFGLLSAASVFNGEIEKQILLIFHLMSFLLQICVLLCAYLPACLSVCLIVCSTWFSIYIPCNMYILVKSKAWNTLWLRFALIMFIHTKMEETSKRKITRIIIDV